MRKTLAVWCLVALAVLVWGGYLRYHNDDHLLVRYATVAPLVEQAKADIRADVLELSKDPKSDPGQYLERNDRRKQDLEQAREALPVSTVHKSEYDAAREELGSGLAAVQAAYRFFRTPNVTELKTDVLKRTTPDNET